MKFSDEGSVGKVEEVEEEAEDGKEISVTARAPGDTEPSLLSSSASE